MFPYYYSTPSDSDYLRALAEERAAREQYAAACRAQEGARARAARARAVRCAYASPYSSFHDEDRFATSCGDFDMVLNSPDDGLGASYASPSARSRPFGYLGQHPFHYGSNPYIQRAALEEQHRRNLMEEQRKRELLEFEREKERRRLEEERIRKILREEKQKEEAALQKALEEERLRRQIREERSRQALREEEARREPERAQMRQQQTSVDPLDILRVLGLAPPAPVSEERSSRQPGSNTAPSGVRRTTPSPVRPFPFGQTYATQRPRAPSPVEKTSSRFTSTNIPVSSPKSAPRYAEPTPEQLAAAEQILDAYRAYISRKAALESIAAIRKRFLAARTGFTLPTSLDYDIATNGRIPTTVTLDQRANVQELARLAERDVLEGAPKLAYSSTNAPLHGYEEELNRILNALDAVESKGDQGVRTARRELARAVEKEAERVERWGGVVWRWWVESQREADKTAPAQIEKTETQGVPSQDVEGLEPETALVPVGPQEVEITPAIAPSEASEVHGPTEAPQETTQTEAPMDVEPASATSHPTVDSSITVTISTPSAAAADSSSDSLCSPASSSVPVADSTPTPDAELARTNLAEGPSQAQILLANAVASESTPSLATSTFQAVSVSPQPVTPALSQGQSEPEEMEAEPAEVPMPPQDTHTSLVALDAEPLAESLPLAQKESLSGAVEIPPEPVA